MVKRVFIIVLDSVGIGAMPDAASYGDEGSDTLRASVRCLQGQSGISDRAGGAILPNMGELGLFHIDGVQAWAECLASRTARPKGAYGRMTEQSAGKDTTIGHWEIAGLISKTPLPVYPEGFPPEVIQAFSRMTGISSRNILCNRPYSGTQVIQDYGREQMETGGLIVYTSADSVFQIAAHESVVPLERLYEYCRMARELLQGEHGVGRVIARPFTGTYPHFQRTANRHDYSIAPPGKTLLDALTAAGLETVGVGKIHDIFAGRGVGRTIRTAGNREGMAATLSLLEKGGANPFRQGLAFVNLVDFDMLYGHRNDTAGYAAALEEFDRWLPAFLSRMSDSDLLFITADHGCDPSTPSTDHSREYTPLLVRGEMIRAGKNLSTRESFADIAATVWEALAPLTGGQKENFGGGKSFWQEIVLP